MNQLENARIKINECDQQIAQWFEKRMHAVEDVIAYKKENGLPIFDEKREQEVIERNLKLIEDEKLKPYFKTYLNETMKISKNYQQALLHQGMYGYQGSEGAFAQLALKQCFPQGKQHSYATFEASVLGLLNHEVEKIVLPFENSTTGEVGEVLDLLFKYDVVIEGFVDLEVHHHLMACADANVHTIKKVFSHHQALSQCEDTLQSFDWQLVPYVNTASAAKYVSSCQDPTLAAIASMDCAETYGLKVLMKDIQPANDNTTRFAIVSQHLKNKSDTVCCMFTVDHRSGQLAKMIQIIADYGFNMSNIRSRALKDTSWQYFFYVEILGNIQDEKMQKMLKACEQASECFKVIGCIKED